MWGQNKLGGRNFDPNKHFFNDFRLNLQIKMKQENALHINESRFGRHFPVNTINS